MMKTNLEVRKEAQKILKTYEATNDFMYAKSWDTYEKKINPKYFEKISDNLKRTKAKILEQTTRNKQLGLTQADFIIKSSELFMNNERRKRKPKGDE